MVTDGSLLLYERLSEAGAGWCNQMLPAALLGGVGLLAFSDSQSPGVGGSSPGGMGFCARGPVGQPSQGELCGGGAGPRVLNSGDRTCLLCGVSLLPSVWNVSELAGSGAGGRQPPGCLRGSGTLMVDRGSTHNACPWGLKAVLENGLLVQMRKDTQRI